MRTPGRSRWESPEDDLPDPPRGYCQRHHRWYGGDECPYCYAEFDQLVDTLEEGDA